MPSGNDLRSLPPEIGNLKSLRTLNISENANLVGVPPTLAHVRTLEVRTMKQTNFNTVNLLLMDPSIRWTPL